MARLQRPPAPVLSRIPSGPDSTPRLAAQQAGRYAEAIALYQAVIADHPHTFDAVHMLGVVHFQRGEFVRARELLTRALEIMPRDAGARHNLQLVDSALERRAIARTICAEILPRFARRCIAAPLPAIGHAGMMERPM
jgi:tetratricopeptide (TPR) repeat protein